MIAIEFEQMTLLRKLRDKVGQDCLILYGDGSGGLRRTWADGQELLSWDNLEGMVNWLMNRPEGTENQWYKNHNAE